MSEKIYVVTSGDYSDYRIEAVFTDRALAEWFVDHHNGSKWADHAAIEEYDADRADFVAAHTENLKAYEVLLDRDGNVVECSRKKNTDPEYGDEDDQPFTFPYPAPDGWVSGKHWAFETRVWARDEHHAAKISNERRAAWIASGKPWGIPKPEPKPLHIDKLKIR